MSYLDKNILLTITELIHMSVWIIMVYVAFYYPEFSILYVLPIWYLTYAIFDECILSIYEINLGRNPNYSNPLYEYAGKLFRFSYHNPFDPRGLLVLGFIIGVYSLKYQKIG
jgi:hypothetical protein